MTALMAEAVLEPVTHRQWTIIVTGSRHHDNTALITASLATEWFHASEHDLDLVVKHGAGSGADQIADRWAETNGHRVIPFEADWGRLGRKAGPVRNQKMVKSGGDVCLAFPLPGSVGTWATAVAAYWRGITVKVVRGSHPTVVVRPGDPESDLRALIPDGELRRRLAPAPRMPEPAPALFDAEPGS